MGFTVRICIYSYVFSAFLCGRNMRAIGRFAYYSENKRKSLLWLSEIDLF